MLKSVFILCSMVFAVSTASAVEIKDARVDAAAGVLEVDIAYGGGCEEHKFELKVDAICLESLPVQCSAQIVDTGKPDMCEAYLHETVQFKLADYGLDDPYYEQARLTLRGSDKTSSLTVVLP